MKRWFPIAFLSCIVAFLACNRHYAHLLYKTNRDDLLKALEAMEGRFGEKELVGNKVATDGNLLQVAIVCRMNDTVDAISRPVALAEPDGSGHRCFYLCHYSRDRNYLQSPNNFTVTKYTDDLAIVWRKTFSLHDTHFVPNGIVATHDGGCFIAGTATNEGAYIGINGWFALKIGADGTVGSGEITVKDGQTFSDKVVKE